MIHFILKNILSVWLQQVLIAAQGSAIWVAACRIFSCGMWGLVPSAGMEPGCLSHWITEESQKTSVLRDCFSAPSAAPHLPPPTPQPRP